MGELLPTVSLEAQYRQRYDLSKALDGQEATTVSGRLTVPLYQGGGVAARIRQAKQTNTQYKRQVESARLSAHSDVLANWGILQSSAAEINSARAAVAANKIALEGTGKEQAVGHRTTLDVLNAQRELVDSEIGLVIALRDRIVAEYSLAAAVGRLDAQSLGLSTPYYDPTEHYDDTKGKWAGLRPPGPPDADN
jgi:outer membrane protein